ncbi:MAG: PorT family protein [Chitinophagales bacterium]|nr:PorT family protein [Chitinophagaceae bacterium]MCB9064611.1 PorT family protein [Chitinophagales bacterium]
MKKILALLLTTFTTFSAFSQYTYGEPVPVKTKEGPSGIKSTRFGLFIAPNSSWMKPTATKSNDGLYNVSNTGSNIGFSWGLMIDHFFDENYGIASGIQLTTSGGNITATYANPVSTVAGSPSTVTEANIDYRLQYLEIPFGLKLMSDNLSGGIRVFGNVGVTAGINISKKGSYEVSYTDTSYKSQISGALIVKDVSGDNEKLRGGLSVTPVLFQMNLGGGIEYQATDKMSFYIGLFFNNGFAPDVTNPKELKMDYEGTFSDGNVRLNNLALKVGMFF